MVDLAASGARPGLLASLARDGSVRVWDARSGACLAAHASDATCLVRARRAAGISEESLSGGRRASACARRRGPGRAGASRAQECSRTAIEPGGCRAPHVLPARADAGFFPLI